MDSPARLTPNSRLRLFVVAALVAAGVAIESQVPRLLAARARPTVADVIWPGDLYWRLSRGLTVYTDEAPSLQRLARDLEERALASYERHAADRDVGTYCQYRAAIAYGRRGYREEAGLILDRLQREDPPRARLYQALAATYGPGAWHAGLTALHSELARQPRWLQHLTGPDFLSRAGLADGATRARHLADRADRAFLGRWLVVTGIFGVLAQLGLALVLAWLIAALLGTRLCPVPLPMGGLRWSLLDVAEVLALLAFLVPALGLLTQVARAGLHGAALSSRDALLPLVAQYVLSICFPLGLLWYRAGRFELPRLALGLTWRDPRRTAATSLAALGLGTVVAMAVRGWPLPVDFQAGALQPALGAARSWGAVLVVVLLMCVVAPVAEETIFRGFLYGHLRRSIGLVPIPAALLSGLVFALMHAQAWESLRLSTSVLYLVAPLGMAAIGALCALAFESSGSLVPAILLHGLWNLQVIIIPLLLVKS